ncbi:transposase zinc-binding domain-containing protein [Pseudomonas yamanorum]|uniref:transposase zinc-binding domain-containing protein n=1 Tax=Pseudomonas yamanorum TaxID=515393 RepID=UPI003525B2A9
MPGVFRIPATFHRRSSRVLACRRGSTASATAIIDACRSRTWNAFSCGSRACPRCRRLGLPGTPQRSLRSLAKARQLPHWNEANCRSWLACDADNSIHQTHRSDPIAASPRLDSSHIGMRPTVGAGLPAMQTTRYPRHTAAIPSQPRQGSTAPTLE